MPMHDWKRVPATIYHHFHQQWTISICNALNAGLLPPGYSALVEQYSSGLYPDVLAVQRRNPKPSNPLAETTTLEAPRTRMTVPPARGQVPRASEPGRHPPSPGRCRLRHRGRVAGEQGRQNCHPRIRVESGRLPQARDQPACCRSLPARRARSPDPAQTHLGRV